MHIYFFVPARFPTEKAYGVTISETARALSEMDKIEVKILSPLIPHLEEKSISSNLNVHCEKIRLPLSRFIYSKVYSKSYRWSSLTNRLVLTYLALQSCARLRKRAPDILVTRELFSALIFLLFLGKSKIFVELHNRQHHINLVMLKVLKRFPRIFLGVIQPSMRLDLEQEHALNGVTYVPMAANNKFFDVGKGKLRRVVVQEQSEMLKICYLGRATSSGQDNQILAFLEKLSGSELADVPITFIGLNQDDLKGHVSRQRLRNLEFISSIPHSEVPHFLSKFDIGLIPYPESRYNRSRFPIKAVEFAACGMPILATKTIAHREILNDSFALFFSQNDMDSFCRKYMWINANRDIYVKMSHAAHNWALQFTYQARAVSISSIG